MLVLIDANIVYTNDSIKKTSKSEMMFLEKGLKKLISKITLYEEAGVPFEKICNDDSIKYDIFGNNFFTYKIQTTQMPLRVLYRFIRNDKNNFVIEVHRIYQKHKGKEYIKNFENYALCH